MMLWQDGSAVVAWFAGLIVHYGMNVDEQRRFYLLTANRTEALRLALEGFRNFAFVGLLEDIQRSGELLAWQLDVPNTPNWLTRMNFIQNKPVLSEDQLQAIRKRLRVLQPMDFWFFDFLKQDFAARYEALRRGAAPKVCARIR